MSLIATALIAGGVSALGNLGASHFAAKESKKAEAELGKQRQNLQNWYDITSGRDYTQTAEAQSAITAARDLMQQQYLSGKGAAVVSGSTDAEAARMKTAANEAAMKTIDAIAARGSQTKQSAERSYLEGLQHLSDKQIDLHNKKAENIQKAGETLSNSVTGLATGLYGM